MFARYFLFKKFHFSSSALFIRNFYSSTASQNTQAYLAETKSLEQLTRNLQNKKVNSSSFVTQINQLFQGITSKIATTTNPSTNRLIKNDVNYSCFLLGYSLKYISTTSILDIFKVIDTSLFQFYKEKAVIDNLLQSFTDVVLEKDIKASDMDYYLQTIYRILEENKKQSSLDLYKHLLKSSNYYESFEQEHLSTIESVLFSTEHRQEFYDQSVVDLEALQNFLRAARRRHPKSAWIEEICKLFKIAIVKKPRKNFDFADSFFRYQLDAVWEMLPEETFNIQDLLESQDTLLSVKMREFSKISDDHPDWLKLVDAIDTSIDTVFNRQNRVSPFEFGQIISYLPRFKTSAPKITTQKLLSKITNSLMLDKKCAEALDFPQLIYLLILSNVYLKGTGIKNLAVTVLTKRVTANINHLTQIIYILPILLNYGVIPREIIELLPTLDVQKKVRLPNDDLTYYIATYISIYTKAYGFNKILHNGLNVIEESFDEFSKQLTFDEKCMLIIKTRRYSSHNRNIFLVKPVIDFSEQIPKRFFAGVVNSAVNSWYPMIDAARLIKETEKRMSVLNHRDLILIGKALIWMEVEDSIFWRAFFRKFNELYKPSFLNNTTLVCDLYQIIYTIELQNPSLYQQITESNNELDLEAIKNIYFTRPNLVTSEEITKSEFELEQALEALKVTNQRQTIIGIHRVDFVVEPNLIIELYGRHHFTERNVLSGVSLWREKQLTKLGYKVVGIALQDWNDLLSDEKKINYLKGRLMV